MSFASALKPGGGSALPPKGERPLKFNASGKYDRVPDDLKKDEAGGAVPEAPLIACAVCGRKFRADRLPKHQEICKSAFEGSQKRGVFK